MAPMSASPAHLFPTPAHKSSTPRALTTMAMRIGCWCSKPSSFSGRKSHTACHEVFETTLSRQGFGDAWCRGSSRANIEQETRKPGSLRRPGKGRNHPLTDRGAPPIQFFPLGCRHLQQTHEQAPIEVIRIKIKCFGSEHFLDT